MKYTRVSMWCVSIFCEKWEKDGVSWYSSKKNSEEYFREHTRKN